MKNKDDDGNLAPTEYQEKFLKAFDLVVEKCKDYCLENKDLIEKFDLERKDLKNIASCLFIKKEIKNKRKVIVENFPPTLYAKLNFDSNTKKISTPFYKGVKKINPMEFLNKRCIVQAAVIFDSILVSSQGIYLQVKVYELKMRKILGYEHKRVLSYSDSDSDSEISSSEEEPAKKTHKI